MKIPAQLRALTGNESEAQVDSAERIVGHYRERFGENVDPERPARRRGNGGDDEFDTGSIYD